MFSKYFSICPIALCVICYGPDGGASRVRNVTSEIHCSLICKAETDYCASYLFMDLQNYPSKLDKPDSYIRIPTLFQMLTDMQYGWPMDYVVKKNAEEQDTFMYQFNYQSYSDYVPRWMGKGWGLVGHYYFIS